MHQLLSLRQTVTTATTGMPCTIDGFLGGGAQGEVYAATLAGEPVAVKWFFPHQLRQDPNLRERLARAARSGPPGDRFLWPQELVTAPEHTGFGYIMPLREARFAGMADLMARRVEPTFRALATAGFELAHSYFLLHAKGLCYRDISFGNVFFDPVGGEVRICDNDNVDIDGRPGAMGGTARFMAPEIVRGEAAPGIQTDLYSLAVLLFYLLVNHHPLEGAKESAIRCFDLPAMTRLYGTEPCFIFDPQDASNRPVPGEHDNALVFWPLYPLDLRELFVQSFTQGLHDPAHGRVRESEWRRALLALRDAIFPCPACGAENFYAPEKLTRAGMGPCWSCHGPLPLPPRLRLEGDRGPRMAMLNRDSRLFAYHLDDEQNFDFVTPLAQVIRHPQHPDILGLRNLGDRKWTATLPGGRAQPVPPGRSITLRDELRIHFGRHQGRVRV